MTSYLEPQNMFLVIAGMTLATYGLRATPFFLNRKITTHPVTVYVGRYLPASIMLALVIYCLRDVDPKTFPHGLPEAGCIALVALLHIWKRSSLLSIFSGTACYMLLLYAGDPKNWPM